MFKRTSFHRWCASGVAAVLMTGGAAVSILPASAAQPEPAQLREKAQDLERKAQALKADGQPDKAMQLMQEVRELRGQAERMEPGQFPKGPIDQRRQELKRKLSNSMAELNELRAAGKEAEAAEAKQRVVKLQEELARLNPQPTGDKPKPREGLAPRKDAPGSPKAPPEEMAALEQRLRHLQVAVDNLHAAGMHEPADQLAKQAEMMRQRLRAAPSPGMRDRGQPEGNNERLRAEIEELRQAIRELRARVDELSRNRR